MNRQSAVFLIGLALLLSCHTRRKATSKTPYEDKPSQIQSDPPKELKAIHVVQTYEGKYQREPLVKQLLDHLPELCSDAFTKACAGLGLKEDVIDLRKITVRLVDARTGKELLFQRFNGPAFETQEHINDGKEEITITIYSEYLVNGWSASLEQELHHEFIHAVMSSAVPSYKNLPHWIREGSALYLANQGSDRIHTYLAMPQYAREPESLLHGLEGLVERHTVTDYPEDFLAFQFLAEQAGAQAPQKFIKALLNGKDFKEALKKLTHKEWDTFRAEALDYAKKKIHSYQDAAHDTYVEIVNLYYSGQYEELIKSAESGLKEHPKTYLAKQISYYQGRAFQRLKKYKEALECFKRAIPSPPKLGLEDSAKFFMGMIYLDEKKFAEAVALFEGIVRDYPSSAILEDVCFQWGFALYGADEKEKARNVLEKSLKSFPYYSNQKNLERAKSIIAEVDPSKK